MVELAVTPDRRWTATTAELLAATAAARFSALGAFADRAGPDVRQLYDAALVRCHEVLALVVSDDEEETVRSAQALADAAAVMGAEWVLTVFRSPLTAKTAPIVQRSAAVIADAGAAMAVEFSPLGPISSRHFDLSDPDPDRYRTVWANAWGTVTDFWRCGTCSRTASSTPTCSSCAGRASR